MPERNTNVQVRQPTAVWRRPRVEEETGLPKSTLYALMAVSKFPKPISLTGGRSVGWLASDVLQWIDQRVTESRIAATSKPTV